jgi:hypothetical protein
MQLPPALLAIAEDPVALSRWLVVVAFLRAFSVVTGYLAPGVLRKGVFPTAGQYNSLSGRLFAVWTAVTCAACIFVAVNLENTALVSFAVVTFAVALAYFILELVVFRTVQFRTAISPFIIASAYRVEHSLSLVTSCPLHALLTTSTHRLCLTVQSLVTSAGISLAWLLFWLQRRSVDMAGSLQGAGALLHSQLKLNEVFADFNSMLGSASAALQALTGAKAKAEL